MKIEKNITVGDLKDSFIRIYPYLNLKVYRRFHDHSEGSPKSEEIEDVTLLGDVNTKLKSGEIVISDSLTVDRLEMVFRNKFGLSVQIFRKSGDLWLQTTTTDGWTLERQNSRAKENEVFTDDAQ